MKADIHTPEGRLCGVPGMFYVCNGVVVWPVCVMAKGHRGKHSDKYRLHRWSEEMPLR